VKQVKGQGVHDADKLVDLSEKHRIVLTLMKKFGWDQYSAKQIKTMIENFYKVKGMSVDPNHYNRTISELLRRKLILSDGKGIPKYRLNHRRSEEALRSGKFGN
jgi:hypothetical protein